MNEMKVEEAKPIFRWAGGKRWALPVILSLVEKISFENYHEPFLGGAAVFFALKNKTSFLSDSNEALINAYSALKQDPNNIVEELISLPKDEATYYQIRARKFALEITEATRFIYLNQLCFNGIYRVNSQGNFNVPFGKRSNFNFDIQNLKNVSDALQNVSLSCQDFTAGLSQIKSNDLVFLDPPYTISHNKNGFIAYNEKLFSLDDQHRLALFIEEIKSRGAYFILTNAAHDAVRDIFAKSGRAIQLSRKSLIGGTNASRGDYQELFFTNIPK